MPLNLRKRLAARRLARQYAIELMTEARDNGEPPESVTAEAVIERMKADGLDVADTDWQGLLEFLITLIERLVRLFA